VFIHFSGVSNADAMRLSARAAQIASDAFPAAMSLKLERVMNPFCLMHVNRYCGAEIAASPGGKPTLLIKGLKSAWRQSAPFLRRLLTRCLELALVDRDLAAAQAHAASEIHRLLSGGVDIGELIMSGGLWRVTGKDIAKAALAAEAGDAEVKGPHAALAVRLAARDPGRVRVLGERVPYVLLAGHKKQDDAAEDPVTAMASKAQPDVQLYWRNKVLIPLSEVFAPLLGGADSADMRDLVSGAHTRVKATAAPAAGTPAAGKLGGFFVARARCLSCRQNVSAGNPAPPLCDACRGEPGRDQETLLRCTDAANAAEERSAAADAACIRCHSGGLMHEVLCANGDTLPRPLRALQGDGSRCGGARCA
jgi:DNA polymerase delta subunit 1